MSTEYEVINTGDAYVVEHENRVTLLTACADLTDFLGYIYELPDGRKLVHGMPIMYIAGSTPIRPKAVRLRLQNVGT